MAASDCSIVSDICLSPVWCIVIQRFSTMIFSIMISSSGTVTTGIFRGGVSSTGKKIETKKAKTTESIHYLL
jgi:hypothetical protein